MCSVPDVCCKLDKVSVGVCNVITCSNNLLFSFSLLTDFVWLVSLHDSSFYISNGIVMDDFYLLCIFSSYVWCQSLRPTPVLYQNGSRRRAVNAEWPPRGSSFQMAKILLTIHWVMLTCVG